VVAESSGAEEDTWPVRVPACLPCCRHLAGRVFYFLEIRVSLRPPPRLAMLLAVAPGGSGQPLRMGNLHHRRTHSTLFNVPFSFFSHTRLCIPRTQTQLQSCSMPFDLHHSIWRTHTTQSCPVQRDDLHSVPHPLPSSAHSRSSNRLNSHQLTSASVVHDTPEARKSATLAIYAFASQVSSQADHPLQDKSDLPLYGSQGDPGGEMSHVS
jgi:hypothetical protein